MESGIDLKAWGRVLLYAIAHPPHRVPEPFRPTFENPRWYGVGGTSGSLNPAYFATPQTAEYILKRFGGKEIVKVPFLAAGSPFRSEPEQLFIRFRTPGGRNCDVNAGWLAEFFQAMPEDEFPGLAERYARQMIQGEMDQADRSD